MKEVYLIDGNAYIYRAYHAIRPLINSHGLATHAIFGFASILRRILREKAPSYLAVAFDSRGPVFRHQLYPEYKANRPPMPEDLVCQIPFIRELVAAHGILTLEEVGLEADDLLAAAAKCLAAQGYRVVIVSGDKDLAQLVSDQVSVWEPMRDVQLDVAGVGAKYGVSPDQLLDYFALIGDSSDNVPGVPGIGPKTAARLISEHGSLEEVYEQLSAMKKSKLKESLGDNREKAFLSRDLIRLKNDCAVPEALASYVLPQPDEDRLQALYRELEFNSLVTDQVARDIQDAARPVPTAGFVLVQSEEQLAELLVAAGQAELLVLDTETTSLDTSRAQLVGISLCVDLDRAWYIPLGHVVAEGRSDEAGAPVQAKMSNESAVLQPGQLPRDLVMARLRPLLESPALAKLGHNIKYDYLVLRATTGICLAGPLYDTMVASHLIDPLARSRKLDDLCFEQGLRLTAFTEVVDDPKEDGCFARVPLEMARDYSCEDVYGALVLWRAFAPRLDELGLTRLFYEVETPVLTILAEMEHLGITVSPEILAELAEEFQARLKILEQEIYLLAGHEFNIQSPKQLGVILFDELGLPHGKKIKTGYSTNAAVLEKLAPKHELPARIIAYRNMAKLLSTYVEKLPGLIDPISGRVHTSFNQTVTATGRLSSSNPNLQNIPIRSEDGGRIRQAFVPGDGLIFLSADYSQIDLRVLAHYSRDAALLKAFRDNEDVHSRTAAELFNVSPLLITSEMRRVAKSINFGIVYGMSSFGLAGQLNIGRNEAQRFIDRYFQLYSGVKTFMEEIVAQARRDGYVTTLLGRRRPLLDIAGKNRNQREFAERMAINTPIQGTAADIIKLAMIRVDERLTTEGLSGRLLLQIHDELVLELPEAELARTREVVVQAMEHALELAVPLVVNCEVGTSLAKG